MWVVFPPRYKKCGLSPTYHGHRPVTPGRYRIYSRFCRPSNRLWKKLMLCMSTTTLGSSLSVGRLTKINSDCYNAINSYHGRTGKSSLASLFYAIKVATIKSAFVALESPTESEHRLLGILEIPSPLPIQCIAESSESPGSCATLSLLESDGKGSPG